MDARPRLFVFGNKAGPRPPRLKDFGVTSENDEIGPAIPGPDMKGASAFANLDHATLTGPYHALPADAALPEGLAIFQDDPETTHHTVYPTRKMTYKEFCQKFDSIAWERNVGKRESG